MYNIEKDEQESIIAVKNFKNRQDFGIRANQNMSISKCIKLMFIPLHNEFFVTWLYLLFSVYFFV